MTNNTGLDMTKQEWLNTKTKEQVDELYLDLLKQWHKQRQQILDLGGKVESYKVIEMIRGIDK